MLSDPFPGPDLRVIFLWGTSIQAQYYVVLRCATDGDWYINNTWNIVDYYKLGHKAHAIMVKNENTVLLSFWKL